MHYFPNLSFDDSMWQDSLRIFRGIPRCLKVKRLKDQPSSATSQKFGQWSKATFYCKIDCSARDQDLKCLIFYWDYNNLQRMHTNFYHAPAVDTFKITLRKSIEFSNLETNLTWKNMNYVNVWFVFKNSNNLPDVHEFNITVWTFFFLS